MNQKKNSIFAFSEINSDAYKESMAQIAKEINNLDCFTQNLESKVDGLLKAQENQFVRSYQQHMFKIKEQFGKLELQMKKKEAQISEYENSGKMANMIKRISFLQEMQKKHLTTLEKKQQEIRELNHDRSMLMKENKRLEEKIKLLLKDKAKTEDMIEERSRQSAYEHIPTFSTEISPTKSKDQLSNLLTQQRSYDRSIIRRSERSEYSLNPEISSEYNRLQKQIKQLKKQNRELIFFNTKFMDGNSTMQNFFIETINEIKKNISIRKQTKQCSLQDFRKEDKLELLIKVLSNDDILVHLHEKIFGAKDKNRDKNKEHQIGKQERGSVQMERGSMEKMKQIRSYKNYFPSINSARLY